MTLPRTCFSFDAETDALVQRLGEASRRLRNAAADASAIPFASRPTTSADSAVPADPGLCPTCVQEAAVLRQQPYRWRRHAGNALAALRHHRFPDPAEARVWGENATVGELDANAESVSFGCSYDACKGDSSAGAHGEKAITGEQNALSDDPEPLIHLAPQPVGEMLRKDLSVWSPLQAPQQGSLGDCWLIAPMTAIHRVDPTRLQELFVRHRDRSVSVRLPGARRSVRVDRRMPVDEHGRYTGARHHGGSPGWPGVLEKAVAAQIAGSYEMLRRGFARSGFSLLLGVPSRTLLRLPSLAQVAQWAAEGRALTASTHPVTSHLTRGFTTPLKPNHVYVLTGADPHAGVYFLLDQASSQRILRVPPAHMRRGVLSVDVTEPLLA